MSADRQSGSDPSGLWALACYFNPLEHRQRLANYHAFRRRLNVPLITVELAYGDSYELGADDAEILIQRRGRDVLWQKERLLNIGLQALPRECDKIAWLDCDVVFRTTDWRERACELLRDFAAIQLFDTAYFLSPGMTPRPPSQVSSGYSQPAIARWLVLQDRRVRHREAPRRQAWGLGWAARRDVLDRHGFYDTCIIGGGDAAMAYAFRGCLQGAVDALRMNDRQTAHYLAWAEPVSQDMRGQVSWLDIEIEHLWHGDHERRAYRSRHRSFRRFGFDPYQDVARDGSDCWCWNTKKHDMHEWVLRYFASRQASDESKDLSPTRDPRPRR